MALFPKSAAAHPLRMSITEIEYSSIALTLSVSLRLFVTDINEAVVFDPDSTELSLGLPSEGDNAESLLLEYLNHYFFIQVNNQRLPLDIESKRLKGEGINTALGIDFNFKLIEPINSLAIKNAVFTDLFFDQSNIIYLHLDGRSKSLMLNKDTPIHRLEL